MTDAADEIAAALTRLRGRGPRGGGDHGGPVPRGGPGHRGWSPHDGGPHGDHAAAGGDRSGMHGRPERFGGPARLRLLEALAAASAPLSVSEAAEAVGVDQPRASRLVQQSVERGLARREADPDDARRTRIALTDDGRAIVGRLSGERRDAVRTALADFTDDERAQLARLLVKLADAWPHP